MRKIIFCILILIFSIDLNTLIAMETADPDLIPQAKAVLNYLESIYGKKSLSGITDKNLISIFKNTGKEPAILSIDLSGWNSPAWGENYNGVVQGYLNTAIAWWKKGGIVSMQCHWKHPGKPDGTAWVEAHGKNKASGKFDLKKALKKGTEENQQLMGDLKKHADFLEQLSKLNIPILWRPLHEVEGGWFWWTDENHPENTAELWKLMFNYFVKDRKLHNLIWVYSSSVTIGIEKKSISNIKRRKRFYPGSKYVDIAGVDVYPDSDLGVGHPQSDTYKKSYEVIKAVAPGKMYALCECEAMPDPEVMKSIGPKWLYTLPWFGEGEKNPKDWIKKTYSHPFVVTLDQLPKW